MNEQLKIIISAEVDKLKKGVADAKGEIEKLKGSSKLTAEQIDANFKKAGESIKAAAAKIGTGIAAAGAALLGIAAATKDYQAEQAKLNAAFETAGASADTAKQVYNDLFRVLGESDVSVEAANHLAKMTTNQKELSEWTNICQGVFATFGDSLPIEGLTEAANETAKVGTVTGTLADALNWAGISEDEFNEKLAKCNTEAEREKLIRETLNKTYNEAAANYEKNAADVLAQNEAQAKLQATLAAVGQAMMPVLTAFTAFGAEALAVVTPYIQQLAENYLPLLQTILTGVADALAVAFTWASQHQALLVAIGAIILTVVTAIGLYNTVSAVKAAMAALEVTSVMGLVAAYTAQAAAMALAIAPYALIVAAIAAVIAIIVLCVKNWDKIKAKTKEVMEDMQKKVQAAIDKVLSFFSKLFDWVSSNWQGLLLLIVNPFAGAFKLAYDNCESFRNKVNTVFSNIKNGISEKLNSAKSTVTNTFSSIKTSISNKINDAKTVVQNGINKIKGFFNFSWKLPKLKLPHFSISGKFSLDPPSAPKFNISWYKLGGIFDSPTLFPFGGGIGGLGEDGAEAIVPLEKNTKWLDRLATMLNEKQGGNKPIVLNVDGKVFAQTSIDTINALTRQKGSLGLNVV